MSETIKSVVESSLCTGCGTCIVVCRRNAISMKESPSGLLFADIDVKLCISCGMCREVCPGIHIEEELFEEEMDPFEGKIIGAFCGYAVDQNIRLKAQSGGIVTALLSYLIESKQIHNALVTKMPNDGSLKPYSYFAKSTDELLHAGGSKYCPVAVNAPYNENDNIETEIAMVGLPCHVHGVRNIQHLYSGLMKWPNNISVVVGLICDRVLCSAAIDYLVQKSGVDDKEAKTMSFRNKERNGWPGEVCVHKNDGSKVFMLGSERIKCKDVFTPLRCRLCFDKMNIFSDLSVGDPYGITNNMEGYSVILVRTDKGMEVLKKAEEAGYICIETIDPKLVFKGQDINRKRMNWAIVEKNWRENNRIVPNFFQLIKKYMNNGNVTNNKKIKRQLNWAIKRDKLHNRKDVLSISKRKMLFDEIFKYLSPGKYIKRILSIIKLR